MKGCPTCGQRFWDGEEFCPKDGATLVELNDEGRDPIVGMTIDGRYSIERKLGEGGMGVVYLATHAVIGKRCALKLLRGDLASQEDVAERFVQEARAAAAIGNEHIIEIADFGRAPDGAPYFVMEYLDGVDIQHALKQSAQFDVQRCLDILVQCCEALAAAHDAGIVHRDLKPENIFLIEKNGRSDFVKILDFGIAKVARESGRLTRTGMIFGTPQYMSPEQAAGTSIDERTDIYSLGIIMYEMLCGRVPFEADTFMGVLTKHLYEEPIPPNRLVPPVKIPSALEAVLLTSIAKKPDRRYQSMRDMCDDLVAVQEGRAPQGAKDAMRRIGDSTAPPPPPSSVLGGEVERADELEAFGKPKWPLWAGVAGVVAVVALALAFFWGPFGREEALHAAVVSPVPEAQPDEEPEPSSVDQPEREADSEPGSDLQDDKEAAEAELETQIRLRSNAPGAELYLGGSLVGTLPYDIPRPTSEAAAVKYVVRAAGYEETSFLATPSTPERSLVELDKSSQKKKVKRAVGQLNHSKKKKQTDAQSKKVEKKKRILGGDIADPWAQ